jgi:hypothetical protein
VTVNDAVADTMPTVAVTGRVPSVVSGTVNEALRVPFAQVCTATRADPMVTVPEVFRGNPRPLTVSGEPTGPVLGFNESEAAPDAADALGTSAKPADPARMVKSVTRPATADRM